MSGSEYCQKTDWTPDRLWQTTWRRALVLLGVSSLAALLVLSWRGATGVLVGGGVLLADILLLKAPLSMLVQRTGARKRTWILALSLLRIVVLAVVLFAAVRLSLLVPGRSLWAGIVGLFVGVIVVLVAMVSAQLTSNKNLHPRDALTDEVKH